MRGLYGGVLVLNAIVVQLSDKAIKLLVIGTCHVACRNMCAGGYEFIATGSALGRKPFPFYLLGNAWTLLIGVEMFLNVL